MGKDTLDVPMRRVLLCVCGGVAAYKAIEVLRALQRAGCVVRVVSTREALRFVGAATWEGLIHEPIVQSLFEDPQSAIPHVACADWADVVLVMPATANILAKMACGLADDVVSTTLLAIPANKPVVVAPAMNVHMWKAQATQSNVAVLKERGVQFVMPVLGHLACDAVGEGKLAPVEQIAKAVLSCRPDHKDQTLAGYRVVVTAGPTHEAIDPVRFLSNASSGKMGYAIAAEAASRGAQVTLVSGPVSLGVPEGVELVSVVSAAQMHDAAVEAFAGADVAVCAAAVADYTPAHPARHKLKKDMGRLTSIELVETADILAELGATKCDGKRRRIVVGFAAETDDVLANARVKLAKKSVDIIVANDVSREDSGFGTDTNRVTLISQERTDSLPTMSKEDVACQLMDRIEEMLFCGGSA